MAQTYLSGDRQVEGYRAAVAAPSTGPRRTQAERRSTAEAALLEAAADLIAERGFERASLRAIGERAGVSRAMPAYHFGSKDALVARLVQRGTEKTIHAAIEAFDDEHPGDEPGSHLESVRIIIETYLGSLADGAAPEERAVVVMWGASFPSEDPVPAVVESDRQTHGALSATLRSGQEDGSVSTALDADAAAWWIIGMARGIAGLLLTQPSVVSNTEVRRLCGEAIVATLAPPPHPERADA